MDDFVKVRDRECLAPGWNFTYNGDTGTLTITTPAGRTHTSRTDPISAPPPVVEKNDDDQPPPF